MLRQRSRIITRSSGQGTWVLSAAGTGKATLDIDFVNSRAWNGGISLIASLLSCARATPTAAYYTKADGTLTTFAANTVRYGTNGLLVEEARTNVVLWSRDMTNAAWTKTSCTAALDQTGDDGVANSASSLLATGANATCLQAITLASSARFQSVWAKRITGSGTINMTMDNGATWTAITLTAAWQKLTIPTQTLANPTVGFRIVTNGDKIAVDFVQNENGAFATSPIPTTTASVTRAADDVEFASLAFLSADAFTWYVQSAAGQPKRLLMLSDDNIGSSRMLDLFDNGSGAEAFSSGGFSAATGNALTGADKVAVAAATNSGAICLNAGTVATDASVALIARGTIAFSSIGSFGGSSNFFNGYIKRVAYWNSRISNGALQTLTT